MGQWILTVNIKPVNLDLLFNVITETQFQLGKAYLSLNLCSQRTDLQGIRRTSRKKPNVLLSCGHSQQTHMQMLPQQTSWAPSWAPTCLTTEESSVNFLVSQLSEVFVSYPGA